MATTIGNILEKYQGAYMRMSLFGCTAEWHETLLAKWRKIGDAIAEDNNITLGGAASLPHETEIGPKAEAAFREFCAFIEQE